MPEPRTKRVYDAKIRKQAVEILEEGAGHRALATKLGIPDATARQWARAYAVGGAEAVLNAGSTHHVYSYETKLAAVQDRVENGMTVREVMIKYGIPSESSIKMWCRQYRKDGLEALINKPRGVKPKKDLEAKAAAGSEPEETAGAGEQPRNLPTEGRGSAGLEDGE